MGIPRGADAPATFAGAMGQIVNVVERPSPRPGIVRFETNRALSGTGHDRYVAGQVIEDAAHLVADLVRGFRSRSVEDSVVTFRRPVRV